MLDGHANQVGQPAQDILIDRVDRRVETEPLDDSAHAPLRAYGKPSDGYPAGCGCRLLERKAAIVRQVIEGERRTSVAFHDLAEPAPVADPHARLIDVAARQ